MAIILTFPQAPMVTPRRPDQTSDTPGIASITVDGWGALMVRAQDGDKAAYHALLHDITPYLRAVARRYLGRGEDAEDAVQEILLVVHDIRHTYDPGRPFKPWLGTLATRRCIDLLRRRSRRVEHEVLADETLEHGLDDSPGPEEATTRLHQVRGIRHAIGNLSCRQQEAVRLLHLNDLSLAEASIASQQSIGALKVACHRALKSLKHALIKGNSRSD